jgi:integrase
MKQMTINNITSIYSPSEFSVASAINSFIDRKRKKSKHTANCYIRYYTDFFLAIVHKTISELNWKDICDITYNNIIKYQEYLEKQKNNSNNSINQKTLALKSLWKELNAHYNENININIFTFDLLPVDENNPNGYGTLTFDEVQKLLNFCLTHKRKTLNKKLFFETAFETAIRKDCLLNLEWKNFKHEDDFETGKKIWVINYHDKGRDLKTAISDDLYKNLLKIKDDTSKKIFNINNDTITDTLKDFCIAMNIPESRNITIHSIKKASGDYVQKIYKDINITSKHLHHKDIQTAYDRYIGQRITFSSQPSYALFNNEMNINELKGLGEDNLLTLIDSCEKDVLIQILLAKKKYFKEEK